MTPHTVPDTSETKAEPEPLVWTDLRPVPTYGLASPPRTPPRFVSSAQGLSHVRKFPGRDSRTPAEARAWATAHCRVWHVPHRIVEDLALIVSELTTNAVVHAPGESVSVAVALTAKDVWAVVKDSGPRRRIQPLQAGADEEHGRGLAIVEYLAHRYEVQPTDGGTVVRACVQLPAPHIPTEENPDGPRCHQ